jgi:hypothetical protein
MTTEEIKKTVEEFCSQCLTARIAFNEYCILYESGQARLDLLNEVAQNFFGDISAILVKYILLSMCKITDPPHSKGNDNLSVKYILETFSPELKKQLGLEELSDKIHSIRDYIRGARHKIIAHIDKNTLLSGKILGAFPKEVGDSFWTNLKEFVDRIHNHYFGEPYPLDIINPHNAKDLVEALKRAVHYDDCLRNPDRIKLGDFSQMRYRDA